VEQEDKLLRYSQKLRKSMTKEERHLWYDFLKTYPVQFRRQYPIAPYIVDFYCYKARLVVELDGSQHCDSAGFRYDAHRTAALEAQGLTVIRFSNLDVTTRFREVCEVIDRLVHCRMSATNTK
jgi:very-short-patch-repair endonuclease